jgi:hypothetical protein
MIRTIDGKKYLMRDTRPTVELRRMHKAFEAKYGAINFHDWLNRGRIYIEIKR